MRLEREYVDPFERNDNNFWMKLEHFGRYAFAIDFIKKSFKEKKAIAADIGCGNGYGTNMISKSVSNINGIDVDRGFIHTARKQNCGSNIEYFVFDFNKEFDSNLLYKNHYDVITAFEFIEHTEKPSVAIKNIKSMLKLDGILIISAPNSKYEKIDDDGKPANKYHKVIFEKKEIKSLIVNNGFEIIEELGQFLPNYLVRHESKLIKKKRIPFNSGNNEMFLDEDIIRYFGYLLAYPNNINIDDSYSYIFIAKKIGD